MFAWLKGLIPTPKSIIGKAIDALDKAVPLLALQLEAIRQNFLKMTSTEQAQWLIDWVQAHLRSLFNLDA